MKKNERPKMRLGVFATAGILLLTVAIYSVGNKQSFFKTTFHISALFKDVAGLQIGNNVRFSGINIGIVDNIQIVSDSSVKVDLLINEASHKFIKKNAKAIIGTDGLMGNTILTILPGASGAKPVENNDYIATAHPVRIDDILAKLKTTSSNAANISDNLAILISNIREGKGTVGKLFMDSAFADNLDKTVVNLNQGASGFKNNMKAAKQSFFLRSFFKDKKSGKKRREERKKAKKNKVKTK